MDKNLTDLLSRKQKQSAANASINWDERRDKYLEDVSDLYDQIQKIFAEPIRQKSVTLQRRPKQLTENYIGTYSIDDLILVIGTEQVRFSPRGRNILGAAGRVDVLGERGDETLILQPDSRWGFVQSRLPKLSIVDFDESTLAEILNLVMRD
jgi:hypothetical protein